MELHPDPQYQQQLDETIGFRVQTKKLFLTYANSGDLTKEDILVFWQGKQPSPKSYIIAREIAPTTGLPHIHALLTFETPFSTRSRQSLLVHGIGVNVQKVGNKDSDIQRVYEYCRKDGDYIESGWDLWTNSSNFIKKRGDFESWNTYRYNLTLQSPYPFTLPDGNTLVGDPDPADKQRHYWLWGETTVGKTYWMSEEFGGKRVYVRAPGTANYPYDTYQGQEVIIFDDVVPKLDELLHMSNSTKLRMPVYGNTRYKVIHLKPESIRTLIVLSNKRPEECYGEESGRRMAAFDSRFIVIQVTNAWFDM